MYTRIFGDINKARRLKRAMFAVPVGKKGKLRTDVSYWGCHATGQEFQFVVVISGI